MSGSSAHPVDVLLDCLLELGYPIDQFDIEGLRAICDAPADPIARSGLRGVNIEGVMSRFRGMRSDGRDER